MLYKYILDIEYPLCFYLRSLYLSLLHAMPAVLPQNKNSVRVMLMMMMMMMMMIAVST